MTTSIIILAIIYTFYLAYTSSDKACLFRLSMGLCISILSGAKLGMIYFFFGYLLVICKEFNYRINMLLLAVMTAIGMIFGELPYNIWFLSFIWGIPIIQKYTVRETVSNLYWFAYWYNLGVYAMLLPCFYKLGMVAVNRILLDFIDNE